MEIQIPVDDNGLTGRECPHEECLGYFKVKFGTGLEGEGIPCHCPYCGHVGPHDGFYTQDQLAYLDSVVGRWAEQELDRAMRRALPPHRHANKTGITTTWIPGTPRPIRTYRESDLETSLTCDQCALEYAIYGVFGWCPDCADHNSLQMLNTNLSLAEKVLAMSETVDRELVSSFVCNSLEDAVSALDAYGRAICDVAADSRNLNRRIPSLQNLTRAQVRIQEVFGFDIATCVSDDAWRNLRRSFQKRHLITHKLGVIDERFVAECGLPGDVVGRIISVTAEEVRATVAGIRIMGKYLFTELR